MATDYDCWHPHNEKVNVELALKTFRENVGKVVRVLCAAVPIIAQRDWTETISQLQVQFTVRYRKFFLIKLFRLLQETVKNNIML